MGDAEREALVFEEIGDTTGRVLTCDEVEVKEAHDLSSLVKDGKLDERLDAAWMQGCNGSLAMTCIAASEYFFSTESSTRP